MKFGKKAGTITSQSSGSTGEWPKGLRAGETRVRFVAEIADWQEYWEHFDDTVKFFPCTGDKATCPGCTSSSERTARASKRYLAPVLDPKTGRIWGLKMGLDLANRLSLRNDRNNGTITNRDYTLIRSGQGLDTEYDVEQEEKVAIDLDAYEGALDLEDMLSGQFAAAWPDFDPDNPPTNGTRTRARRNSDDEDAPPARKRAARKKPAEEPAAPAGPGTMEQLQAAADKARSEREAANGGNDDDPPSEAPAEPAPAVQEPQDDSEGETVELTEEDLRAMSRTELMKLAREADLSVTLTMGREEIIAKFMAEFGA